jgi:G:T/U-mismatch repair DNA glycosylase
MAYKVLNDYKEEIHPWEPFVPANADKLILGTFPTSENNRGALDFFYPNPNNNFWRLIFQTAGKKLEDYVHESPVEVRKQVLRDLRMGIADIGRRIFRQRDSSKDDNLFPIEYTDIFSLLDKYRNIQKVIITSSSGCNSVLSWFRHYANMNSFDFAIPKSRLPVKTKFSFNNREIEIEVISSPSRLSPIKGDILAEMYRNAILGDSYKIN